MSGTMLTWLPDVLRQAGCTVVEYSGWETRARSSGGYASGRPWCVVWHHTASNTTAANDANYMCHVSDNRPICNLMVDRSGTVWVLAAGCTNTNGSGRARTFTRGTVPADSMNSYAVGMELCNTGVGESFPQVQIDAAFKASIAITERAGLLPGDVCTHQDYAPDRKVDPAMGGNTVQGPWHPRTVTNSGTWSCDDLKVECERRGMMPASVGSPAVAAWDEGRLDVFITGTDGALWHRWYPYKDDGNWSHWESLGGTLVGAPTVASWAPGRLDVFGVGQDNALWTRYYDNKKWSAWISLGRVP